MYDPALVCLHAPDDTISMTMLPKPPEELIAFLDANIVLEGRPAEELPWTEISEVGLIRVLIVPKAMDEIDSKKHDGRLGKHARAFNRLIKRSLKDGQPIILRDADPRVELQMAMCSGISWDEYDELDPNDGDSKIVAQALNVRDVASQNRVLVSHDIKPLLYASNRGLSVHQASDDWLRSPQPTPQDKKIQQLKQELAKHEQQEPKLQISIEVSDIKPLTIYRVALLGVEQAKAITALIKKRNPKEPNGDSGPYAINSIFSYDSTYDQRFSNFVARKVPDFVASFSKKLELLFNQRLLKVRVTNVGDIRADHLAVSIKTSDGWINDRVVLAEPSGPVGPEPEFGYRELVNLHRHLDDRVSRRVGLHEFETTLPARRSSETKVSCEDFHSKQTYYFEGVVAPTSSDPPIEISVSLTAKNLRGEQTETLKLKKQIVSIKPNELVDLKTLVPKRDFPIKEKLNRLIEAEEYDQIELDDVDD